MSEFARDVAWHYGKNAPVWDESSDNAEQGFIDGAEWGAGWAFALVGMAQAIRESHCCMRCGEDFGGIVYGGPTVCTVCV